MMNKTDKKIKMVKLGEVCEIIAGQSPPSTTYNNKAVGLPFYQGKADFGERNPIVRKWCSDPVKIAKNKDILISVRAPVGPTNIAVEKCCIGRGLSAIRCKNEIYMEYLLHFLRWFESRLESQGKGATFKAITQKDLKSIQIPLPPLAEQKRIAEILDLADEARRKRKKNIALYDDLIRSLFLKTFGDPVSNPMGWEKKRFDALGTLERGKSKHRPRNAPELLGGSHPLIQTGDVSNASWFIKKHKQTYSDIGLKQSRKWSKGTLCITIAANIADVAILNFDACFPDSIVGFTPSKKINNSFVMCWLFFLKKLIEIKAPAVAQKNINLKILRELELPVPPLDLQNQFAERVQEINAQKEREQALYEQHDNLFNALLQRAFKGDL